MLILGNEHGIKNIDVADWLLNEQYFWIGNNNNFPKTIKYYFGEVIRFVLNLIENQIQVTAQAADELLNLNGIECSFVLSKYENKVYISGRSTGEHNVQVILEKFGGGGHMMIAGAQIENAEVEDVKKMLISVIGEMKK